MKILAVGPHPDDVEFGCAPLLIQEAREGHDVRILVLSKGEAGTSGAPEERAQEARNAAAIIGATVEFLDFGGDCHLQSTPERAIALAGEIRRFQPDIVLAPHPEENQHPDHSAVAAMVRDASRLARYGGLDELRGLPPHSIRSLYYFSITHTVDARPDLVIDVSEVETEWEAAMKCHQTQMRAKSYLRLVQTRARALGAAIGVEAAVGLWVNDPIRVRRLSDLDLSSRNF